MGSVLSLNVGLPRVIGTRRGEPVLSGIVKEPVDRRLAVRGVNIDGDGQADLTVHGGPDKAIYAYAIEDLDWWSAVLGRDVPAGMMGENLTTEGIDCTEAVIGEHWRIGDLELEVCQPRLPCFKLGMVFDDPMMLKRFGHASKPGVYLRIVEEADIGAGDPIEVVARPDHGITVREVSDAILKDRTLAPRALSAPQLAVGLIDDLQARAGKL